MNSNKLLLPSTRYYGSKRKLIEWIWECILDSNLKFESVLDLFGGSGTFSYYAKKKNKTVFYNDLFKFNYHIGNALIANNKFKVSEKDLQYLTTKHDKINYLYRISNIYKDVYYTEAENELIDIIVQNIQNYDNKFQQSLFYYILIQSCITKRPFNLFHRKNLYLRLNNVKRNFGNKNTWDIPFEVHMDKFTKELNKLIFSNKKNNEAYNYSALECPVCADLVYLDPPYINKKSTQISYLNRYHFLEALTNYNSFDDSINFNKKNLEVQLSTNKDFELKTTFFDNLQKLFYKYSASIIVLSYRINGVPSIEEIENFIKSTKRKYKIYSSKYSYALHKNNDENEEYLFIVK